MMKAIGAAKKKSEPIDARKIADLVRCNLLPACYVAPPRDSRTAAAAALPQPGGEQAVRMKNKMAGLLMEAGAEYNKEQLHGKKYFASAAGRTRKRCRNR